MWNKINVHRVGGDKYVSFLLLTTLSVYSSQMSSLSLSCSGRAIVSISEKCLFSLLSFRLGTIYSVVWMYSDILQISENLNLILFSSYYVWMKNTDTAWSFRVNRLIACFNEILVFVNWKSTEEKKRYCLLHRKAIGCVKMSKVLVFFYFQVLFWILNFIPFFF